MTLAHRHLAVTAILLALAAPLRAQTAAVDSTLRATESLYYAGSYVAAEIEARRLLEAGGISDSNRVRAEKWIAFALIAQGKAELSREHFRNVLRIDPGHELDPILVSPKIVAVFNEVKSAFRIPPSELSSPGSVVRAPRSALIDTLAAIQVPAYRQISIRTILFPGWEQLYSGRTKAGTIFLSAGAVTLGAGITLEFLRSSARKDYLSATVPSDIASKYDKYNSRRKAEAYAFVAFGLVYLASEVDVLLNDTPVRVEMSAGPEAGAQLTVGLNLP